MESIDLIKEVVSEFPNSTKEEFENKYKNEITEFIYVMSVVYDEWKIFDKGMDGSEELAHVSSLIYGAINMHCISMHLFITGLPIASGNMYRQVIESVAMGFLCSKPSLGYLKKYAENKYSTNKAVRDVIKKHKILNLNHSALQVLKESREFYDKFSHPTLLTTAMHMSLSKPGVLFVGSAYDSAKEPQYAKEISSRLGFAKTLTSFISGITENLNHTKKHA